MEKKKACPIVPINDRIVVQRLEAEGKTPGGVLIPDSAREKPKRGRVLAVGPGRFCPELLSKVEATADLRGNAYAPMPIKAGDLVLFTSYAGNEVTVDGEDYLILSESDVLGILEE